MYSLYRNTWLICFHFKFRCKHILLARCINLVRFTCYDLKAYLSWWFWNIFRNWNHKSMCNYQNNWTQTQVQGYYNFCFEEIKFVAFNAGYLIQLVSRKTIYYRSLTKEKTLTITRMWIAVLKKTIILEHIKPYPTRTNT